jgi:hypothetical protein
MRLKVSRQERPASTRMLAVELENTVQLPRLPLAKTVILIGTQVSITGMRGAWKSKLVNPVNR